MELGHDPPRCLPGWDRGDEQRCIPPCCADGQSIPQESPQLALPLSGAQLQLAGRPNAVSQLWFVEQDPQAALEFLGSGREERER